MIYFIYLLYLSLPTCSSELNPLKFHEIYWNNLNSLEIPDIPAILDILNIYKCASQSHEIPLNPLKSLKIRWITLKSLEINWLTVNYLETSWHLLKSLEISWNLLNSLEIHWKWLKWIRIMIWMPKNFDLKMFGF